MGIWDVNQLLKSCNPTSDIGQALAAFGLNCEASIAGRGSAQ